MSHLSENHRHELEIDSAIDPEVITERGYLTIERPGNNGGQFQVRGVAYVDGTGRDFLRKIGIPSWAIREDYYFPGLWIPQYTPRGERYAGQWKPFRAVPNREGKRIRYASAKGVNRLDVHPRWTADRGQRDAAAVPAIQDPAMPLWITEGVKKADALTSRGCVTVALSGVYNWRNTHASLGDWEDVRLKGREIWICFDADTVTKPDVQRAMDRLGRWLRSRGAVKVQYLVVPPGVNGKATKGVDDWFAAGGTLEALQREARDKPPRTTDASDRFTDAALAETLAAEVLDGAYVWAAGLEWLGWDGRRWAEVHEVTVIETVRSWAKDQFAQAAAKLRAMEGEAAGEVDGWRPMLSASRIKAVLSLARGIVERKPAEFDADPDLINTPSGVVNLMDGQLLPHDPDLLMTKITSGSYRPGFTHKDWTTALTALPVDIVPWFQARIGQAITGRTTPDGVVPILQGGGENGKGALTTGGLLFALGGYAMAASTKLFMSTKNEHSTERADLRGQRWMIAEELTEGRSIDVTALKQIADVERVRARKTHKDNVEFDTTHSLMATTNYVPVINETDHGTWRRLALVRFPFKFVKPGDPIVNPEYERRGDPTLKPRLKDNPTGQHDAMVTWAIEGAVRWYASVAEIEAAVQAGRELPASVLNLPPRVVTDTLEWRVEADRILGFWHEMIDADPDAAVLAAELCDVFNAWLRANGHTPWAKETFGPRFAEHTETKTHRVTRSRTRQHGRIVRPPHHGLRWLAADGPERKIPRVADVWAGLRYRIDEDR
jgi:P4 family phage/plasmid primase-like protien